jgi:hypothetical protein
MQDEVLMKFEEMINNQKTIITYLSKIFILLDKYDTAYQNEIASSVKEE